MNLVTCRATTEIRVLDGVECRLWVGITEAGVNVDVFVHRLRTRTLDAKELAAFDREFLPRPRPRSEGPDHG